nr:kinesin-like protein KIN-6 isoform X2 [Ipomoea batatas]
MVNPLVNDFIRGRSTMLAALGPSGSGKTHTIFGYGKDPGMVTLALRKLFSEEDAAKTESSRYFYLSMFEICSEKGKSEKIFDLAQDRTDLCSQQTSIKGLQEVSHYTVMFFCCNFTAFLILKGIPFGHQGSDVGEYEVVNVGVSNFHVGILPFAVEDEEEDTAAPAAVEEWVVGELQPLVPFEKIGLGLEDWECFLSESGGAGHAGLGDADQTTTGFGALIGSDNFFTNVSSSVIPISCLNSNIGSTVNHVNSQDSNLNFTPNNNLVPGLSFQEPEQKPQISSGFPVPSLRIPPHSD